MKRMRWFKLSSKSELEKIERQIRSRVFSLKEPVSSGFRVEKKNSSGLLGQFIYKRTVDQKIMLPSGEEFVQEVANIEVTTFGIDFSSSAGLLYLIDFPRSSTPFFSALSEATLFSCTLESIEVNVEKWIEHLISKNDDIAVVYLDVADISVSRGVKARVAIAAENGVDVVSRESMPFGQKGRVESAKIRYACRGGLNLVVELGYRATLKTPTSFPMEEIQVLRKAMLLSTRS